MSSGRSGGGSGQRSKRPKPPIDRCHWFPTAPRRAASVAFCPVAAAVTKTIRRVASTRPFLLATAGYTAFGIAVLGRSIWPGRTLVPADLLRAAPPYGGPGAAPPHNQILSDPPFQFFPWFRYLGQALR